jgi:hypothetical protein
MGQKTKDFKGLIQYLLDIQSDLTEEEWKLLRFIAQHELNHIKVSRKPTQEDLDAMPERGPPQWLKDHWAKGGTNNT